MNIVKRDGTIVPYDLEKISIAISGAFEEIGQTFEDIRVLDDIEDTIKEYMTDPINIEDIQDLVEDTLIEFGYIEEAKAYVRYRYEHNKQREAEKRFEQLIHAKLRGTDVQNQNANLDELSFGGRMGEASNELMKKLALDEYVSPMARKNHEGNMVYIHDLDHYAVGNHNCLSVPFDDLLEKGFNTRQTDVRPANSISTAMQLVAVIFQLQSLQQFGGVSATHLDWTMVPYVRKSFYKHYADAMKYFDTHPELHPHWTSESYIRTLGMTPEHSIDSGNYRMFTKEYNYAMDKTIQEVHQAVEGMYHNLNTLQSRSGNQLPFTSINYGTCTLPEGRMVIRALLEVSIEGLGKLHKTSIFPCGIFQCMKGINRKPGDPNYDLFQLALKSTAQRLYPNYANVDWSGNEGYDFHDPKTYFSTMGCRTTNGWDINGLGQQKDGRGNICPTTIILPTLAMMAKQAVVDKRYTYVDDEQWNQLIIDEFFIILEQKIEEAKDMLLERFEWICSQPADSAKFMYENNVMAGYVPEEGIKSALKHGTLALGQIGIAETLQILIGCNHVDPKGMKLAKEIEQIFKDKCAQYKKKYSLNFGVYYTPAENLCYTAMKKFKQKYGELPNISDREYFTNSIHVPVWEEVDVFEKIDIESQLTGYSSAGCITYVELDSTVKNNLQALETIVNYAMDKDIPYFAINVPNDTCLQCGYCDEFNDKCPMCGSTEIQQLRRVTGYLTGDYKTAFNKGKQQETEQRVRHIQ